MQCQNYPRKTEKASPQFRGERAFNLRNTGLKWKDVAAVLGYTHPQAAQAAAARYADRKGLVAGRKGAPRPVNKQRKKRACLGCGRNMISHHFGERICGQCKSTVDWASPTEYAVRA